MLILPKKITVNLVKSLNLNKVIKRFYPGNKIISVTTIKKSCDSLNIKVL
jgi:hypothetical protein